MALGARLDFKTGGGGLHGQGSHGLNGINAACGEEGETGGPSFAEFEEVDRAEKILIHKFSTRRSVDSSQNAGVRRAVNDPIAGR